jgi:hypothetical protein
VASVGAELLAQRPLPQLLHARLAVDPQQPGAIAGAEQGRRLLARRPLQRQAARIAVGEDHGPLAPALQIHQVEHAGRGRIVDGLRPGGALEADQHARVGHEIEPRPRGIERHLVAAAAGQIRDPHLGARGQRRLHQRDHQLLAGVEHELTDPLLQHLGRVAGTTHAQQLGRARRSRPGHQQEGLAAPAPLHVRGRGQVRDATVRLLDPQLAQRLPEGEGLEVEPPTPEAEVEDVVELLHHRPGLEVDPGSAPRAPAGTSGRPPLRSRGRDRAAPAPCRWLDGDRPGAVVGQLVRSPALVRHRPQPRGSSGGILGGLLGLEQDLQLARRAGEHRTSVITTGQDRRPGSGTFPSRHPTDDTATISVAAAPHPPRMQGTLVQLWRKRLRGRPEGPKQAGRSDVTTAPGPLGSGTIA